MTPEALVKMVAEMGGKVTDGAVLSDGSGFAVASFPLRTDHWIYVHDDPFYDAPPMPFKCGTADAIELGRITRIELAKAIREAAQYAVRAATMHGTDMDFDPDALVQNMVTGMLGYNTPNGLDPTDDWANPRRFRKDA